MKKLLLLFIAVCSVFVFIPSAQAWDGTNCVTKINDAGTKAVKICAETSGDGAPIDGRIHLLSVAGYSDVYKVKDIDVTFWSRSGRLPFHCWASGSVMSGGQCGTGNGNVVNASTTTIPDAFVTTDVNQSHHYQNVHVEVSGTVVFSNGGSTTTFDFNSNQTVSPTDGNGNYDTGPFCLKWDGLDAECGNG